MVRSMQLRCKELTAVAPDMAKSAATVLCLGVHHILMGPGSDLGPIDFPGECWPAGQKASYEGIHASHPG